MQNLEVMHRNITLDTIGMRRSSAPSGYKVERIGALDFAYWIKSRFQIMQNFNVNVRMAPEIEAG